MSNFSYALEALKTGNKVQRIGWNGKRMFVVLQKGYPRGIPCNKQAAEALGINFKDIVKINPWFQIQNVNGSFSTWVPSVSDCLAEDWLIVE